MFSKAKRFEPLAPPKILTKTLKKSEPEKQPKTAIEPEKQPKIIVEPEKPSKTISKSSTKKTYSTVSSLSSKTKNNDETQSLCSSVQSVKSFPTPKPLKLPFTVKTTNIVKKITYRGIQKTQKEENNQNEILRAQEVEIRNKDHTIMEYNNQIEELKAEIACLQKKIANLSDSDRYESLSNKLSQIKLDNHNKNSIHFDEQYYANEIEKLKNSVGQLERDCDKLELEVSEKQVELSALEEVIIIRDSLCKDLQDKLTSVELCLEETHQRLEMVKGHHALALEANESIRREYKVELEALKIKMEDEKQSIINKNKCDQEDLKLKYNELIVSIKNEMLNEKNEEINELQEKLEAKNFDFKAKLDQINEATHEKLRLCEIQFEERTKAIQEHWSQQQNQIKFLENETKDLKYKLSLTEEQNNQLHREISNFKNENDMLVAEKYNIYKEINSLKEESKKKIIDFENEINKLTVEIDKSAKEKSRFQMSLSVTRDIVQVLTMRLRESDSEVEELEKNVQSLTDSKNDLENELTTYKSTLNKTLAECNEYKEALVNILQSKAALAKEHTRIMEHNVSLIESLQNIEKEAYRELGSIKSELIEDVEFMKKESSSQIQMLREEVEKKRMLCELATEHAGQATAAAEQSRMLLSQAAVEISRLEADNERYQQQIEDQQSLVVELSLLRQENEELSVTVAKQSSIIDKMKKDYESIQSKPKSPSVMRKSHKIGKENVQTIISPLRERNH